MALDPNDLDIASLTIDQINGLSDAQINSIGPEKELALHKREYFLLLVELHSNPDEYWIRNRRRRMEIVERLEWLRKIMPEIEDLVTAASRPGRRTYARMVRTLGRDTGW